MIFLKKHKGLYLTIFFLFSFAVFFIFSDFVLADNCYNNNASGGNPIALCSCSDLNLTRGNLSGKYQLQNAIDCSATSTWNDYAGFTPIGTNANRFTGTFDGQGFNISNLNINLTSTDYVGLFGVVDTGSNLSNIGLVNVNITGHDYVGGLVGASVYGKINNSLVVGGNVTGNIRVGGLVGNNYGNINNSYAAVDVFSAGSSSSFIGGFVGLNSDGNISFCYATGNVHAYGSRIGGLVGEQDKGTILFSYSIGNVNGSSTVGGLVGFADGTSGAKILNSYSTSNVTAGSGGDAGGLLGFQQNSLLINNSYARGNVSSSGGTIGGLVGSAQISTKVDSSYATGAVRGGSTNKGLIGSVSVGSYCFNSYWDNQTTGQGSSACGVGRNTTDMLLASTYTNNATSQGLAVPWDFIGNPNNDTLFKNFWHIVTGVNDGYPFLTRFSIGLSYDVSGLSLSYTTLSTNAGNFSQDSIAVNVTAPDTDIATIVINLYNSTQLRNSSNQSISPFFVNHTNLPEGVYYVNVTANDTSGNPTILSTRTITLDRTAPVVTLVSPSNAFVNNTASPANTFFNCSVTDVYGIANISLYLTNGTNSTTSFLVNQTKNVSGTVASANWTVTLRAGNYTWNCLAYDFASNLAFATSNNTLEIYADGTAPLLSIVYPTNGTNTSNNNKFTINYTVSDQNLGSCWYSNDSMSSNTTLASCTNITTVTWSQGTHNVIVWANDTTNNKNSSAVTFSMDSVFPSIIFRGILNSTNGSNTSNSGIYINFTAFDTNLGSCWYTNDSLSFNVTLTGCTNITNVTWSDGLHTVIVWANDTFGNKNFSSLTFTVDTAGPSIILVTPSNNTNTSNTGVQINYTASDTRLSSCWYSNDSLSTNTTLSACANITSVVWSEGIHTVLVWANDTLGNKNNSAVTFTIDTIVPRISIIYPLNNSNSSNTLLNINYSVTESNLASCLYSNDSMTSNITLPGCANITSVTWSETQHNLTLWVNDSAGNSNYSRITFTIDATAPTITLISPLNSSGDNDGNISFNYNVNDLSGVANCSLILNTIVNQTNVTITKNVVQNFSLTNLTRGQYNWSINCSDAVNNIGNSISRLFYVISATQFTGRTTDLTLINISNVSRLVIEDSNYGAINFTTNLDLSNSTDINSYVNISFNRISLNSSVLSALNKSAVLVLYNLTFTTPRVLIDGDLCSSDVCTKIDYSSGTLMFNVTHFSTYSAEETPVSSSSSSSSSSSGGGGGGSVVNTGNNKLPVKKSEPEKLFECTKNSDCNTGQYCTDYRCKNYECTKDSQCNIEKSEQCFDHRCTKLFDVAIMDFDSLAHRGEFFNFTYFLKGMANISDDVVIRFWIEKNGTRITDGQDTLYLGSFDEKVEKSKLLLPLNISSGVYDFYVQVNHDHYSASSQRVIEIGVDEKGIVSIVNGSGLVVASTADNLMWYTPLVHWLSRGWTSVKTHVYPYVIRNTDSIIGLLVVIFGFVLIFFLIRKLYLYLRKKAENDSLNKSKSGTKNNKKK